MTTLVLVGGCKEEPPETPKQPKLAGGDACDPTVRVLSEEERKQADELPPVCATGLACEPLVDGSGYMCATALEIRGRVTDSTTNEPLEGALIAALNETGEPVTDVVASDACGDYVLPVSVRRTADGEFAETPKWTLNVSAADHLPFPAGLRPALPVDIADAVPNPNPEPPEEDEEAESGGEVELYVSDIITNAATDVALIPLGPEDIGGYTVSGVVVGEVAAGTLVVAEGTEGRAPYGIADASGQYTLFNVPEGDATIRAYRRGLEIETAAVSVADDLEGVDLALVTDIPEQLATVSGTLSIVNATGGAQTSVVLVPASVFNEVLERGPVPLGLRAPEPPIAPNITGDFSISQVPSGTYKVLVAFENDGLVRDPDPGIAGTSIQEVNVDAGQTMVVENIFKVTQALAVMTPGSENPEVVEAEPMLQWGDDTSEDLYQIVVFDALGNIVWEIEQAGNSAGETVELAYGGPALVSGMYYQFRVTSLRLGGTLPISRTEDLRGVFVHGEAPAKTECIVEESDTDAEDGQ